MPSFMQSKDAYESWLLRELKDEAVPGDLKEKSRQMRQNPFLFLRGTYWRWAEFAPELFPDLMTAPEVLAVGDIHLENFGTWRDADGRLVWGVNDFDEAAAMPYGLDLVRLAASAVLGHDDGKGAIARICGAILAGYAKGLAAPCAIVLDHDWAWLRAEVVVPEDRRAKFWKRIDARECEPAPERFRQALAAAMPEPGLAFDTARRIAGTGSLGRPRWVGVAQWRGAPLVREAKALTVSAWCLERGQAKAPIRCGEIAGGRFRAPDPWYRVEKDIVVRRLSPNNHKIEADKRGDFLFEPEAHEAMGLEIANVHLGTAPSGLAETIASDLASRKKGWFASATETAVAAVTADFKEFKRA